MNEVLIYLLYDAEAESQLSENLSHLRSSDLRASLRVQEDARRGCGYLLKLSRGGVSREGMVAQNVRSSPTTFQNIRCGLVGLPKYFGYRETASLLLPCAQCPRLYLHPTKEKSF